MTCAGNLYVVATPIGNLDDLSPRAIRTLNSVGCIAAEDTRHSAKLLTHFGIHTPLVAYHEHNEDSRTESLLQRMLRGQSVALISDAGTPLLSDPGYRLVRAAHLAGLQVVPVPGASALAAALSVAGLPTDRFFFEGFLSAKSPLRRKRLAALHPREETLVFYESCHRLADSLSDIAAVLGAHRQAALCRELTKTFETVCLRTLGELLTWVRADPDQQRGEVVLVVAGCDAQPELNADARRWLTALAQELPPARAAAVAARATGLNKRVLYQWLQEHAAGEP